MRGQLSLEMLVVIVVVLGLVLLLASVVMKNAEKASDKIEQKANSVIGASDSSSKAADGEDCANSADCLSGTCSSYKKCI